MSIVVVSAVREELGTLAGEILGVGPIVSAIRMERLLARTRPSAVVLLGTAGTYSAAGPSIGAVVASSRLGWSSGVDVLGIGYTPGAPAPIDVDEGLLRALGLPGFPVLTTAAVTTDDDLARRLGAAWAVEHLESFGVAFACREAGVPFAAVLGIANEVGPHAHAQWLRHRDAAQDAARAAVAAFVQGGQFLSEGAG
jgi:purine-nucleoside phosphorylase